MRILIDLDGTIANWGAEWDKHASSYTHLGLPLTVNQKNFDLYAGLTAEGRAVVNDIMNFSGFYANLEPFEGSVEAVNTMVAEGHDVRILTAPWITNETCASDKYAWVEKHLGSGWGKRTVLSSDKTVVRGDILIDDKPVIEGSMEPEWEHIYFTQPYNVDLNHHRRINNWSEWRSLLDPEPAYVGA